MEEIGSLIGKILLVGITLMDDEEQLIGQVQVYGAITHVDGSGIIIKRNGSGTEFYLPPDFSNILPADEGEYRLRSTGEVVVDPDYLSSWTVRGAKPESLEEYSNNGFSGFEPE